MVLVRTTQANQANLVLVVSANEAFRKETVLQWADFLPPTYSLAPYSFQEAVQQSQALASASPAVLIDLEERAEAVLPFVREISEHFSNSKIVCVARSLNVPLILKLVRMGVKDFLQFPFQEKEVRALFSQLGTSPTTRKFGKTVTLFSPKGGAGVTFLATNLAIALAANKELSNRVVVCDLALQCGDVANYFNLTPEYTWRDLIEHHEILDPSFLEGTLLQHSSGVRILASPRDDQEPLNFNHMSQFQSVLSLLRQACDITLIDAGQCDAALLHHALMQSDLILLLGNLDVPSLKGLAVAFGRLTRWGYDPERIKLVINRYNAKNQLDIKELEKAIKHPVACCLPNNYSLCIEAVNTGRPLSEIQEGSSLVKKIGELATLVEGSLNLAGSREAVTAASRQSLPFLNAAKKEILGWQL